MAQRTKGAVPSPRSGGRGSALIIAVGLIFAAGVGFAVGYTVGKKSSEMQPMQLVGSREKPTAPAPTPPRKPAEPEDPLKAPKIAINVPAHAPTKGPADAPITIVEFSEFQ